MPPFAPPPPNPPAERRVVVVELPESLVRRAEEHWPDLQSHPAVQSLAPRQTGAGAVRAVLFVALEQLDARAGKPPASP